MVAYNFQARFEAPLLARTKRQTIRAEGRKRHARAGETIQLQAGPRFHPRRLGLATCEAVDGITLSFGNRPSVILPAVTIDAPADLDAFAVLDGFASWRDLAAFWAVTHGEHFVFEGLRISWGETFVPTPGT